MKRILFFLFAFLLTCFVSGQEVLITGYIDSSCPQAKGRTLEIYISGTVNLSAWNLVRQSNGNGYTNNISIGALGTLTDEYAYITNDTDILQAEFDIGEATVIQTGAINDNGDDAFQIQDQFGNIIDRFGEEGIQPNSNSPWYHKKTYYYRKNGESANHGNFNPDNWNFGPINMLLGEGLCNGGDAFSSMVPFGSFNPFLCEPITSLPYIENFENNIPPNLHNCATIENNTDDNNWETAFINKNGFHSNVLKYEASENPANTWFFTRGIALEPGIDYELTYRFGNNDPLSNEKLQVAFGNLNESTAMNILNNHTQINSGKSKLGRAIFNVNTENVYYLGFKASSDANQNELYLDDIQINIVPNCLIPINPVVENLEVTSVELSWLDENENSTWNVVYGENGFNPETEGEIDSVEGNSQVILEDLIPGTAYDVYIKSECASMEESQFSEVLSFTTLCEPAQISLLEDFEAVTHPELPECSLTENGSAGNNWETTEIHTHGFDGKVLRYQANESNPARAWFFTKGIELEAGMDYQMSYAFGNNSTETTEKLKVSYGNSPKSSAMTDELADYTSINQAFVGPGEHIFSVATDGIYYFGFLAYSDADQGDLYLDNIEIKPAPSCLRPTQVAIQNIGAYSAEVIWNDANNAQHYELVYGMYGFDPQTQGENLLIEGNTETSLENLESGTTYQVYIKTHCQGDDESEFSFATTFMTDCTIQDIPFIQDFESAIVPGLPNCATSENVGYGNNWETYDESQEPNSIMNSKVLRYEFNVLHAADAWYFTNGINLHAGINYQISYEYANNTQNPNFFEKLKVAFGNSDSSTSMQTIADHPHISGGITESHTVVFSVPTNGVYYFGFHAYSNFNASVLYLDNIQIDFGPTCPYPTNLYYTNLSHNSVDFTWDAYQNTSQWEVKYGFSGFNPESGGFDSIDVEGEPEVHISGLQSETFYDVYIRSHCGEGALSDWEGPKTFKTRIIPPQNNLLCDALALNWNDECTNGPFTTIGAFSQPDEPPACFNYPGKTVWFSFQAPENGEVTISSDFLDPVLTSQVAIFEAPIDCEDPSSLGDAIACAGYSSNIFISDLMPSETYYIQVAANSNKEGEFCIEVKVDPDMSVEDQTFRNFSYYPNPMKNELSLNAQTPIESVVIFNLQGKKLIQKQPNLTLMKISTSNLASGIYFIQVRLNGKLKVFKILKE